MTYVLSCSTFSSHVCFSDCIEVETNYLWDCLGPDKVDARVIFFFANYYMARPDVNTHGATGDKGNISISNCFIYLAFKPGLYVFLCLKQLLWTMACEAASVKT